MAILIYMKKHLMVQQQVKSVWQHMVGVICLNLTNRVQVKAVLPKLFKKYPNPITFIRGHSSTQKKMLKPLGMVNKRLNRLKKMSIDFLTWDYKDANDLHGIGKYGSDSYRIFYKNEIPENVQDKELKKYLNDR
tara:strand:- start:43 stop:444 length:402 start_codon:yes stop_codon:yes gene_type:complete